MTADDGEGDARLRVMMDDAERVIVIMSGGRRLGDGFEIVENVGKMDVIALMVGSAVGALASDMCPDDSEAFLDAVTESMVRASHGGVETLSIRGEST